MSESPRTPWHLWTVGILSLLWNAMGAFDYLMTQTRNAAYMGQFTPEQLDYFYGFPTWVVACWAISVWGSVLGSVLLLLRRRIARDVFLVVIFTVLLTTLYNFVLSNGLEIMGGVVPILFSAAIIVIAVLLYVYARAQAARGLLR